MRLILLGLLAVAPFLLIPSLLGRRQEVPLSLDGSQPTAANTIAAKAPEPATDTSVLLIDDDGGPVTLWGSRESVERCQDVLAPLKKLSQECRRNLVANIHSGTHARQLGLEDVVSHVRVMGGADDGREGYVAGYLVATSQPPSEEDAGETVVGLHGVLKQYADDGQAILWRSEEDRFACGVEAQSTGRLDGPACRRATVARLPSTTLARVLAEGDPPFLKVKVIDGKDKGMIGFIARLDFGAVSDPRKLSLPGDRKELQNGGRGRLVNIGSRSRAPIVIWEAEEYAAACADEEMLTSRRTGPACRTGWLAAVPPETKVAVVGEGKGNYIKVRLLAGASAGTTGYVSPGSYEQDVGPDGSTPQMFRFCGDECQSRFPKGNLTYGEIEAFSKCVSDCVARIVPR